MQDMLSLTNVSSGYGRQAVIHDVSLSLGHGDLLGFIGPNGHGKSTLLRTISGFLKPRSGHVALEGQMIAGLSPDKIVSSGIVHIPQGDMIFPDMSVHDNLMMGAYLRPAYTERSASLRTVFELFPRLGERINQVASSLSGGERRMLAIGRGMMSRGKVLMIDEPSLGLAPIVIEQIYDAIRQLKASGWSILLVEENASRIVGLADQVCLIDHGKVAWAGHSSELGEIDELSATYFGG